MKLATASHVALEAFFRDYLQDDTFNLPPITFHSNVVVDTLTKLCRVGAITFGRHVVISSNLIERDAENRRVIPGWLAAHEAMHVAQYEQSGWARFLTAYVGSYLQALRLAGRCDAATRMAAYLMIPEEQEARRAEAAYLNQSR